MRGVYSIYSTTVLQYVVMRGRIRGHRSWDLQLFSKPFIMLFPFRVSTLRYWILCNVYVLCSYSRHFQYYYSIYRPPLPPSSISCVYLVGEGGGRLENLKTCKEPPYMVVDLR